MRKCSDGDTQLGMSLFLAACSLHYITPMQLDVPYDLPQLLFPCMQPDLSVLARRPLATLE